MNQKPDPNKSVKPQDGGASSPAPSGADKGSENKQTKRAVKGAAQSVGSKVGKTMAIKGAINKAGSMLANFVNGISQSVMNFFGGMAAGIKGFLAGLGIAQAMAGTLAVMVIMVSGFGTILLIASVIMTLMNPARYDAFNDCRSQAKTAQSELAAAMRGKTGAAATAQQTANAKLIYSALHEMGIPDVNIAGAIANANTESSLDPTKLEACYVENFIVGPRKTEIMNDTNSYVLNTVFPAYERHGIHLRKNYYKRPSTGEYAPGLGFFQYTGPEFDDYMIFCEGHGLNWYDPGAQLAYALNGFHKSAWLRAWTNPEASPEAAAVAFATKFEEAGYTASYGERQSYAAQWYSAMGNWEVDTNFANSVMSLVSQGGTKAGYSAVRKSTEDCLKAQKYNNSGIAEAALSFAYANVSDSKGSKGTELWQAVHDAVMPGDSIYQSCDRTVCGAVRWAGADDSIPEGNADAMYRYFKNSPKWEQIEVTEDMSLLQPGDIICEYTLSGEGTATCKHVIVYTGKELANERFPGMGGNSVSGSYNHSSPSEGRSPALVNTRYKNGPRYQEAFRCIQPEANSKYKNVGIEVSGVSDTSSGHGSAEDDDGGFYED